MIELTKEPTMPAILDSNAYGLGRSGRVAVNPFEIGSANWRQFEAGALRRRLVAQLLAS